MLTYNGSDLILAPIAGYSDSGMRSLCFRYGVGLCFTEMVSAKGLYYDNENTESLLKISKDEPNTGVQIFGSDPDIMAEVVNYDALKNFKIVDVNCGCPVQKIVRNGEGSALMHNPELVLKIVSSIRKSLSEDRKITVKIRKGIGGVTCAKEVALAAQEGGASLVTVHGRTREQMYSGSVDYQVIKEVKDALSIPVCGNGDVVDRDSYLKMKELTGVDYVMVARGAIGRPYVFKEIMGESVEYNVCDLIKEHISYLDYLPDRVVCNNMKKQIAFYVKGIPGQKKIKDGVFSAKTLDSMLSLIDLHIN